MTVLKKTKENTLLPEKMLKNIFYTNIVKGSY